MIFSEAVNIAEDLAKVQTEEEHEASTSLAEISPIREVLEVPLMSEAIPSANDVTTTPSDPSLGFTDHTPTDEVEEIPLPAVTDSEPIVPEDAGEESDEEVVPLEEILDPAATEPSEPQEILGSEPPSTVPTESPTSESVPNEREPEPTDVSETAQPILEALEPPAKVEVLPATVDEDEDIVEDEAEPASASGPSDLETKDDDEDDGEDEDEDDEDESQPANELEAET